MVARLARIVRSAIFTCALAPWLLACADEPPPPPVGPPAPPPAPVVTAAPLLETPPAIPAAISALGTGAMLFDDLGAHHRAVTASAEAAAYFDQGLRLVYGFNHDEAVRSFVRGAQIDPACAMCFWGAALAMGPNYNVPMLPEAAKAAWEALQRAVALAPRATPVEQALIAALAKRYKGPEPLDPAQMAPQSEAYAAAMRGVAKSYPDDDDVQVLFAESMMDVNPWKLWTLDGAAAPGTEEIVATLERVLARAPQHPGANHYCIHAIEASPQPERALPCAERLAALMPGAGHVVHMPAHVYQRVGRYGDAAAANEKAVRVDLEYMKRTKPPGYYAMYLGHNYGFLAFAESMLGRGDATVAAARNAAKAIPPQMVDMMPGMDFFVSAPPLAMVRFGKWDDLLSEPRPAAKYRTASAFWLHGHGMALAAKGKLPEAHADLAELQKLGDTAPAELTAGNNAAKDVYVVAAKILEARLATLEKMKNALEVWADATARADKLAYSEPDDWFYPVRHLQGAAQLAAHKAKDAEATYREDLRRHPHNGWALFGLWKSLEAQGKGKDAKEARAEFETAWAKADVKLVATGF
jgi:tetratricopeptide (TPR) repeat protein